MAADLYDGITLSSEWRATGAEPGFYRLTLTNRGTQTLGGFRLGVSGPALVIGDAVLIGGRVVAQLSNYCEVAPPDGFMLAPDADWVVDILKPDLPIRHWTDGAVTGFLIDAAGNTTALRTIPTRLAGSDTPGKRGTKRLPVPERPPVPVSIVPWPQQVDVSGRRTAPQGLAPIATGGPDAQLAIEGFNTLTSIVFPGEGLWRPANEGGYPVDLVLGAGGKESYAVDFLAGSVRIAAEASTGWLYGLVTVGHILRGARDLPQQFHFPTSGRIEDAPQHSWRGSHLDVARNFMSTADVCRFVALLAWNKLNVLHWHLSDDEAWRVEIDAYPGLVKTAAWRGHGLPLPPLLGSGPERSGGYYTRHDIRKLVELAAGMGVEIVPEIDMPGHCYALLEALPQLRDPGENARYLSIQSFPNNALNPGVEGIYPVLETILDELVELFPSRYFHLGADEVPHDAWHASPAANALRQRLGVEGAAPLQAEFLRRLQSHLTLRGKITGAWEEAAQGGGIDRAHAYLVGWKDMEISQKLAAEGYDVVVAPAQAYYLDMANGPEFDEPGAAWAGWSSLEQTYAFEPAAGWSEPERAHLLGIQACIWSEPMSDRAVFDRLVFPRLSAIAETAWTAPGRRDFARFSALAGLMPNLYGNYDGGTLPDNP